VVLWVVGAPRALLGPFYRRSRRWRSGRGNGGARRTPWGAINGAPAACGRRGAAHGWRGGRQVTGRLGRAASGAGSVVRLNGGGGGQQCRAWACTGAVGGESGACTRACALTDAGLRRRGRRAAQRHSEAGAHGWPASCSKRRAARPRDSRAGGCACACAWLGEPGAGQRGRAVLGCVRAWRRGWRGLSSAREQRKERGEGRRREGEKEKRKKEKGRGSRRR
jgi:hypothetical protein